MSYTPRRVLVGCRHAGYRGKSFSVKGRLFSDQSSSHPTAPQRYIHTLGPRVQIALV